MAIKPSADLLANNTADITSASAPNSITPAILGARRADDIESMWNKLDGIKCQFPSIPAAFTGLVNTGTVGDPTTGDQLNDILFQIMTYVNELAEAVVGGVQGLIGEYLAIIESDTRQTINVNSALSPINTYRKQIEVNLVNDKDNGGFDNGNNWLVYQFLVPSGYGSGKTNVNFFAKANVFKLIQNSLGVAETRTLKYVIAKNGTALVSSNEILISNGDPVDVDYYINDFTTGNITIASITASDVFTLEIYEKANSNSNGAIRIQLQNGFFYNKLS